MRRVLAGEKIVTVARELDINYGNAKCIMAAERKKRLRSKSGRIRKLRSPRLLKLFVVERLFRPVSGRSIAAVSHLGRPTCAQRAPTRKPLIVNIHCDSDSQAVGAPPIGPKSHVL